MSEEYDVVSDTDPCFKKAIVFAKFIARAKGYRVVTPEILMLSILNTGPNVVTSILTEMHTDVSKVIIFLTRQIEIAMSSEQPELISVSYSKEVEEILRQSFQCAAQMKDPVAGCHHIFIVILKLDDNIKALFHSANFSFKSFKDFLYENVMTTNDGPFNFFENEQARSNQSQPSPAEKTATSRQPKKKTKSDAFAEFCVDLTQLAEDGKLDPVIGREREIDRIITTLGRKNKNNPLLVGSAGVGKTAIVEGVAQLVAMDRVPHFLSGKRIYSLDMTSMVAGTQYRGQFEDRMKKVLQAIKEDKDCIIFVDEVHTLLGAGSASGTLDAGNIMKPYLARGELRCIAATTDEEYKKYLSKDRALERRFQRIYVDEPNQEQTLKILQGLRPIFEKHHNCVIAEDAMRSAVKLSSRYVLDKHFPDKAIDVIDEACVKQSGKGSNIITAKEVHSVLAEQANLPFDIMSYSDFEKIEHARKFLEANVVGQRPAIDAICQSLMSAYSGVHNPERPLGIFLFGGQSAVGKTYVAEKLSEALFDKNALIRINLSEFSEHHQQSKLIGSPPGYVGYGERNQLTDMVSKNPYSLILLDEVEKAHPSVLKLFLQIFSNGTMVDSEGHNINFKHCLFIMTTNLGQEEGVSKGSLGFMQEKENTSIEKDRLVNLAKERFGPEFVNRIDNVVVFKPFTEDELVQLATYMLDAMSKRVFVNTEERILIGYSPDFPAKVVELSKKQVGYNANKIGRVISNQVESVVSEAAVKDVSCPYLVTLFWHKTANEISCKRVKRT